MLVDIFSKTVQNEYNQTEENKYRAEKSSPWFVKALKSVDYRVNGDRWPYFTQKN